MSCQMRHQRLQFAAMAFFVAGFIFAGSGWSLVLAGKMQNKPEWSVCGQDLCLCLPPAATPLPADEPDEPKCVLCVDDTPQSTLGMRSDDSAPTPTDPPKRVPKNDRFQAASMASQAGCTSIFLSFVFGTPRPDRSTSIDALVYAIDNDKLPADPTRDLPTPPPRA